MKVGRCRMLRYMKCKSENLKRKYHFGNSGTDGRIILK
jgi:hypothetical protein